ncbi:MAG: hypothetical protein ACKVQR_05900 [Aquabacterium sp.]
MFLLVTWLFVHRPPGVTVEQRVSQFVGAWGILFMIVGMVVIAAAAIGRFRSRGPSDLEK